MQGVIFQVTTVVEEKNQIKNLLQLISDLECQLELSYNKCKKKQEMVIALEHQQVNLTKKLALSEDDNIQKTHLLAEVGVSFELVFVVILIIIIIVFITITITTTTVIVIIIICVITIVLIITIFIKIIIVVHHYHHDHYPHQYADYPHQYSDYPHYLVLCLYS